MMKEFKTMRDDPYFQAARQLGVMGGGEFRSAVVGAKLVPGGCGVVLGDRPLAVTAHRLHDSFGYFERKMLKWRNRLKWKKEKKLTQDVIERSMNISMDMEIASNEQDRKKQDPRVTRFMQDERDRYMIHVLHTLLEKGTVEKLRASKKCKAKFEPLTVVAVVGMGHVPGMRANWAKRVEDVDELLKVKFGLIDVLRMVFFILRGRRIND